MLTQLAQTLRTFGWWVSDLTAERTWVSWLIHAVFALPFVWVMSLVPWTGPGLLFLYREGEQVWHRFLSDQEFDWVDHIMDVLAPAAVGWYFLHGYSLVQ